MKKLILLGAAALMCSYSADAASKYVVWSGDALTADEVQMPAAYNGWWNMNHQTVADSDSEEGDAWRFASADGSNAASCGYWVNYENAPEKFDLSLIANRDLVFNAKIEGEGSWTIRLTSPDADAVLNIPNDGKYHEVRLNVPRDFGGVLDYWNNQSENQAFVFSPVGVNLNSESALYVNNVRYEESVPMPEITASVAGITATSADLTYNVAFAEGYSNTEVTINGESASTSATLNLTGLTPKTDYTYTIVASGEYGGKTYSAEEVVTLKTARENGDYPVWYGRTDKEGFTAVYSITYNPDKTLTVEAVIETELETPEADRNFHIFIGGDEWLKLKAGESDPETLVGTTTSTFEEGAEITWEWYLPYAGGVYQETNKYVVGSENEKPADLPRLEASLQQLTYNSATIDYVVKNATDFSDVVVKMNGEVVTESPVVITGLTENTEYTYTFSVSGSKDGETLEGKDVTVSFKTPLENAKDLVYADYVKAEIKNAYLVGEDAANARTFYVSLPFQVTYSALGEGKYEIDLSQVDKIVGLVPQIYWNGFQLLVKNETTGLYEYNFGQQEADAEVAISHYLAYAGGTLDQRSTYTKWGMEQVRPQLGDAAALSISIPSQDIRVMKPFAVVACVTDAEGYYLNADEVEYSGQGVSFADGMATVANKGDYTVTANVGDLESKVSFVCFVNSVSENLISGKLPYAFDAFTVEGAEKNLTDGNDVTEAIWNCTESDEHYMYFDLGDEYGVEGVAIVWEGAYAVDYDIIFSLNKFDDSRAALKANAIINDHTINVVDNNTTHRTHPVVGADGYDCVKARYVAVKTSKALNSDWGIKPRELKVFGGNWAIISGVESVDADNADAEVEYYNLQGIRVAEPANGIYIRRQGNASSKVILK